MPLTRLAATAWGNSLFVRDAPDAIHVASEPLDNDPTWRPLDDRALIEGTAGSFQLTSL